MHHLTVATGGAGLHEITAGVTQWVQASGIEAGLLTVYIHHTSASVVIQENADSSVCRDLEAFFSRVAPQSRTLYTHNSEGPDDMPAHIRAALTATQVAIPVRDGRPDLGTWQGIFVFEHRTRPRTRRVSLYLAGD